MNKLELLESDTIKLLKSVPQIAKKPAVLWSTGKDSTTVLYLIKKAFGYFPWPVIHIDTGFKPPEVYAFRNKMVMEWSIPLKIIKNAEGKAMGFSPEMLGRYECCTQLKTNALKYTIEQNHYDALILSIRHDEHYVRGMEDLLCFVPGTIIPGVGMKTINSIIKGDLVYTCLGSLKPVNEVSSRFYQGPLISIQTKYNFGFRCTPNHIVLAKRKGTDGFWRISWSPVGSLKVGDKLLVPGLGRKPQDKYKYEQFIRFDEIIGRPKGFVSSRYQTHWKSAHSNVRRMRASLPINPDVMRLLGYYIAEGNPNEQSHGVWFTFGPHETYLVNDAKEIAEKNFRINTQVIKRDDSIQLVLNSQTLTLVFKELCGKGARNKKLPYFFPILPRTHLKELIKGCWRGDGSKDSYSTNSSELAIGLRTALLRLGIISAVYPSGERYYIEIPFLSQDKFTQDFEFGLKKQKTDRYRDIQSVRYLDLPSPINSTRLKSKTGGYWLPIKEIINLEYCGTVYDLTISDHHSYLAGGLAAHNSLRDENGNWQYWARFGGYGVTAPEQEGSAHVRVNPILPWTETDVWQYVMLHDLPVNPLYFAYEAEDGKFYRYRSLGCEPCTQPVESKATTILEILNEVYMTPGLERSGRMQDKEAQDTMLRLRSWGYM